MRDAGGPACLNYGTYPSLLVLFWWESWEGEAQLLFANNGFKVSWLWTSLREICSGMGLVKCLLRSQSFRSSFSQYILEWSYCFKMIAYTLQVMLIPSRCLVLVLRFLSAGFNLSVIRLYSHYRPTASLQWWSFFSMYSIFPWEAVTVVLKHVQSLSNITYYFFWLKKAITLVLVMVSMEGFWSRNT